MGSAAGPVGRGGLGPRRGTGPEVREDLVDDRRLGDARDDAHCAMAGRAGGRVDLEDLLQHSRPAAGGLGRLGRRGAGTIAGGISALAGPPSVRPPCRNGRWPLSPSGRAAAAPARRDSARSTARAGRQRRGRLQTPRRPCAHATLSGSACAWRPRRCGRRRGRSDRVGADGTDRRRAAAWGW